MNINTTANMSLALRNGKYDKYFTDARGKEMLLITCPYCYIPQTITEFIRVEETTNTLKHDTCSHCQGLVHPDTKVLFRHTSCGYIWHLNCLKDHIRAYQREGKDTRCPRCNKVILYFGFEGPKEFTYIQNSPQLSDLLRHFASGATMKFLPGDLLKDSWSTNRWMRQLPRDFQLKLHLLSPTPPSFYPPGSEFFCGATEVCPGVMKISHCPHVTEYVPMRGDQTFEWLSKLYLEGYCPLTLQKVLRVSAERGITLPQLIYKACQLVYQNQGQFVDIPYPQLANLWPFYDPFRFGLKLILKVVYEHGRPDMSVYAIAMWPRQDLTKKGQNPHHESFDDATTRQAVEHLGGLCPGVTLRLKSPDIRLREGQAMINAYRDINNVGW